MKTIEDQPRMYDYSEEAEIYIRYHGSDECPARYPLGAAGYISLGIASRKVRIDSLEAKVKRQAELLERAKEFVTYADRYGALKDGPIRWLIDLAALGEG